MRLLSRARRLAARALFAGILVAPLACDGDDYDSPMQPHASLASRGALSFSCGVNCSYEGEAVNNGAGCADNVRGITRLLASNGSELANDEWQLAPARRINAGEAFLYGDCCFSLTDRNNMGSYRTEIFWDETTCY